MEHGTRKHALLSASGASRWINCPPSARLEEAVPERGSSRFADEGTLAHEFADISLQKETKKISASSHYNKAKTLRENELYTDEMEGEVEKYTSYVLEQLSAAKKLDKDAVLLIEEKVDLTEFIEEGFGTCDANIIGDGVLEIIDLKYGKGVKVSAVNNSQLALYAMGAIIKYDLIYDLREVKMTIHQPRLDHISSWTQSVDELERWAAEVVRPAAALAYTGEGVCKAGDHCRWCKVKAQCRAMHDYNMQLANHDFCDPKLLTDEEILEAYTKSNLLQNWAASIAEYILQTAQDGKAWDGLKVVEGRSVRKWADDKEVFEKLKKAKYRLADISQTKVLGITKIEKLLGQSKFTKLLGDFVIKPQGKPTLAPMDDKRPALGIEQAKEDFAEENNDLL
jgi:hypothetical protein